jgi:hypothetical protein
MNYNNDKLIASAFVKARATIGGIVIKDAKGNFGKYATLAAITEIITSPLATNGLAVIQEASMDEQGVVITTTLLHESGATMQFAPLPMPLTNRTPQAVGSALTYGRRYALAAICGLAPDDDDGQAAQDTFNPGAQKAPQRTLQGAQAQSTNGARNTPVRPSASVEDDVTFEKDNTALPTDEELEIMAKWHNPQEAQAWAVAIKACLNDFAAQNSFKKVVDEHGGKLTKANIAAVYLAFVRKQLAKVQHKEAA